VSRAADPCGCNKPLERRDPRAQHLAVAQRDRRGPKQRQRRVVLQRMLDEEILDVVDVARIGVAEVRQICRALAMLARGALGRLVRGKRLRVDIELIREPLNAGDWCVLKLHRAEPSQRIAATAIAVASRPAGVGRRRSSSTSPSASVKYTPMRTPARRAEAADVRDADPEDRGDLQRVTEGRPIVLREPRHRAARAFVALAAELLPVALAKSA
jgi:hypothetical protein